MHSTDERTVVRVLDTYIDAVDWATAVKRLVQWGRKRESRYVCICNVHSVVIGALNPGFAAIVNRAAMATPDGAPIAWMLRRLGISGQERINGPDLLVRFLSEAEREEQIVSFYGGSEETLSSLRLRLLERWPNLKIGAMISPPYRSLFVAEDDAYIREINEAGTAILFVGLGCPKQEEWMSAKNGVVKAAMVGVGAAFDFHAGTVRRAPTWMQSMGLEWLHRLWSEPRRLWRRYLIGNTIFVMMAARQLAGHWVRRLCGGRNGSV